MANPMWNKDNGALISILRDHLETLQVGNLIEILDVLEGRASFQEIRDRKD